MAPGGFLSSSAFIDPIPWLSSSFRERSDPMGSWNRTLQKPLIWGKELYFARLHQRYVRFWRRAQRVGWMVRHRNVTQASRLWLNWKLHAIYKFIVHSVLRGIEKTNQIKTKWQQTASMKEELAKYLNKGNAGSTMYSLITSPACTTATQFLKSVLCTHCSDWYGSGVISECVYDLCYCKRY